MFEQKVQIDNGPDFQRGFLKGRDGSRIEQPSALRWTGFMALWLWGQRPAFSVCLHFGGTCWLTSCPIPVMSGHTLWAKGSQEHTVFMQWGATSASVQWNTQINSLLFSAPPTEKTQGRAECSKCERWGWGEVESSGHTPVPWPHLPDSSFSWEVQERVVGIEKLHV